MKTYKVGDEVSHDTGVIVLAQRSVQYISNVESVVLCISPAHHEFVVWLVTEDGDTVSGHYFLNLDDALRDYGART